MHPGTIYIADAPEWGARPHARDIVRAIGYVIAAECEPD